MISDISTQSFFSNSNVDMGEAENYCVCRPAIIVRPYSAEDVAIVVTFAVRHGFQVTSTMVHYHWFLNWIFANYFETSCGSFLSIWEQLSCRYQEMRCAIFLPTVDNGDTMSLKHISVTSRGAECIWFPSSFLCSFVQCRGNFRLQLAICPWVWSCTIDKIYYHVEKSVPFADVITWLSLGTRWQWVLFWFLGSGL